MVDTVSKTTKYLISIAVSSLTLFALSGYAEESHPGLAVEAMYTEALLEYNKNHIPEAAAILDKVLKRDPNYLPALEMRALTLKMSGDDKKAIQVYTKLIEIKPDAEEGPYHFELATIFNRRKNIPRTKYHLNKCLKLKFNEVPVNLLSGTIAFNAGNFASAEEKFSYVKDHAPPELQVVARYYLGLVNFRMGYGTIGTAEILEARALAQSMPENKSAEGILTATDQILAPFQKPRWFVNMTTVGQYDSNIAQLPLGISNPNQLSGKSTPKVNFSGGFGWMGAPMNTIQLVASYRLSLNKNLNSNTKGYEFFTNSASLYANYRPLAQVSGGMKLEGNLIFQNLPETTGATDGPYVYGKSSLTVETGPFIKFFVTKNIQVQTDLYYRQQDSFLYPTQDGDAYGSRMSVRANTVKLLFNPAWSLSVEKSNAVGADVRYLAYGGGFSNSMRLSSLDTVTTSIDVLSTNYNDSALKRADLNIPIRLNWSHMFNIRWSLMCDVSYVTNSSSISESYSYNRITSGIGVGWAM